MRRRKRFISIVRRSGVGELTEEQNAAEIAKINARYDFSKLYENKDAYLPTDETGKIILDPNNPNHREWMED